MCGDEQNACALCGRDSKDFSLQPIGCRKVPAAVSANLSSFTPLCYTLVMKVIIGSISPVKEEAVKRGFKLLFPETNFNFECVKTNSGVSDQPMSNDEMRTGALGRVKHAQELSPGADFYVGLEGGAEEMYGELYNYGWVIIESANKKQGCGRTLSYALPTEVRHLMIHEGMEQSHAVDKVFAKSETKMGTGTIGPLTKDSITYTDWYTPAVVAALIPFLNKDLY